MKLLEKNARSHGFVWSCIDLYISNVHRFKQKSCLLQPLLFIPLYATHSCDRFLSSWEHTAFRDHCRQSTMILEIVHTTYIQNTLIYRAKWKKWHAFFSDFLFMLENRKYSNKKRKNNYKLKFESNRGNGYILTLMPIHKMLLNRLTRCYFPWNWTWIKTFFSLSKRDSEPIALHHWNRSTVVIINVHIHTHSKRSPQSFIHIQMYIIFHLRWSIIFLFLKLFGKEKKKTIWWNKNKWLNKKKKK